MYGQRPEPRRRPRPRTYDVRPGSVTDDLDTFAANVPNGANQSDDPAWRRRGRSRDSPARRRPTKPPRTSTCRPGGGAVCWEDARLRLLGELQRLAAEPGRLAAAPAGIPDGMALRRTIAPGCATLLEPTDDRDNSAADFALGLPRPAAELGRPHRAGLRRPAAAGGSAAAGAAASERRPRRPCRRKPREEDPRPHPDLPLRLRRGRARPSSASSTASRFKACRSPFTTKPLSLGTHTFRVRARDDVGQARPLPRLPTRFRVASRRAALADVEAFAGEAADVVGEAEEEEHRSRARSRSRRPAPSPAARPACRAAFSTRLQKMWPPSSGRIGSRLIRPSERLTRASSSSAASMPTVDRLVGDVADRRPRRRLACAVRLRRCGRRR